MKATFSGNTMLINDPDSGYYGAYLILYGYRDKQGRYRKGKCLAINDDKLRKCLARLERNRKARGDAPFDIMAEHHAMLALDLY